MVSQLHSMDLEQLLVQSTVWTYSLLSFIGVAEVSLMCLNTPSDSTA